MRWRGSIGRTSKSRHWRALRARSTEMSLEVFCIGVESGIMSSLDRAIGSVNDPRGTSWELSV